MYNETAKAMLAKQMGGIAAATPAYAGDTKKLTLVDEVNSRLADMNGRANMIVNQLESFFDRVGIPAGLCGENRAPEPETIGLQTTEKALSSLNARLSDLIVLTDKLQQIA